MTNADPIVAGVDGSKESRKALVWACEQAQRCDLPVTVISTWTEPTLPIDPPFGSFPSGAGTGIDRVGDTRTMLGKIVDEISVDYPKVEIRQHVQAGNAAQELIKRSEHADLVVVGSKGHGGFAGMLVGSVSQHVLAHSACTVVVVR
jgi:nucleotide-binding universal stress UspA family protein